MAGGTEFRFVTDGIESALAQASDGGGRHVTFASAAASRRSASICAPGSSTTCIWPHGRYSLGSGEPLFEGLDLRALGYECVKSVPGERATHVFVRRRT